MKIPDTVEGNVAKIAALFPHCVTECKSGGQILHFDLKLIGQS